MSTDPKHLNREHVNAFAVIMLMTTDLASKQDSEGAADAIGELTSHALATFGIAMGYTADTYEVLMDAVHKEAVRLSVSSQVTKEQTNDDA